MEAEEAHAPARALELGIFLGDRLAAGGAVEAEHAAVGGRSEGRCGRLLLLVHVLERLPPQERGSELVGLRSRERALESMGEDRDRALQGGDLRSKDDDLSVAVTRLAVLSRAPHIRIADR
jgi:hypothetical protein